MFDPHQAAYKEHHNTETAQLNIINDLLTAADRGKESFLAILDMWAAFDKIVQNIFFMSSLYSYGNLGTLLKWLSSKLFLSNSMYFYPC